MKITLWVAALIVGGASTPWHPRTAPQCSSYCKESTKIRFDPGTVYNYNYVADSVTSLKEVADSESHIQISAKVEIEAESECELILRVQDASLLESDSGELIKSSSSEDFAQSLEKHPLRFSYQDGAIESICVPSEDAWVVNIKRGILSALQNSMTDFSNTQTVLETDIAGYCETNYTKVSSSTVRRTKNLQGCSGRHAFQHTNMKMVPYNTMSSVQSLPLIKSEYTCDQTIRDDFIQSAFCKETHTFRPFSSENSGAATKITQSLTFKAKENPKLPFPDVKLTRSSLIFDPASQTSRGSGKDETVADVLENLVKSSEEGLNSDVPALFGMLINELKQTNYAQMATIYRGTKEAKARKFLIDALPSVGNAASFGMLRDLVREKSLSEMEENVWLSSLAFQARPTIEMITAVAPLLKDTKPSKSALLGISSLIHHYCTSVDCNESDEIKAAIRDIEQRIGTACRAVDDDSKEAILVALKALGNTGIVVGSAAALKKCYQEENPMEIRLAAVAAARRVDCEFDRSNLMTLFRDVTVDSELRIAAYLAVMKCPSPKVLEEVKEALRSEPVNQVGSFVWTHLTNLQESSDPNKLAVKELLENEFFKNKFNTDIRKFSRNIEFSSFWEELNLGGTVESNIVFSTQSYLPRSAMLNLTVDLFGESVNLLEVGGRVEGLEPLVEQLFGPDGYIPDDTVEKVLKSLRGKREVDTGLLNQLVHSFGGKYGAEPEASGFVKVFGNELLFSRMKGFCAEPDCNLFKKFNMGGTLDSITSFLKEPNVDYTKSLQFLDVSSSIPTAIGLPLTLSANGTSTISLKMAGKVSTKNWRLFDINGYIKPSAVVEINSVMAVNAGSTTSGIKVQNRMRTATSIDGKIQIDGAKVVSAKISTPEDKMEVFEVSSDVFIVSKGRSLKPKIDVSSKKACSSDLLGTSLCGEIQYPKGQAPLPLVPSKAVVYIGKTDKHTGYQFDYKWMDEIVKKQTIRTIMVTFDMPGSKYDRRLATKLIVDEPGRALRFSFHAPTTKLDATGKYVYTDPFKSADLVINIGGEEFATLKAALRSDEKLNSGRFEPSLLLTSRGVEILNLQGIVNYVAHTKYGVDLTLTKLTQKPIRIIGDLTDDNGKYDLSATVRSYLIDSSLKGNLKLADNNFSTKMSVDYSIKEGSQQRLDVAGKWSAMTKGSLQKYNLNWNLKSTQYPVADSELLWELQTSPNYIENQGRVAVAGEKWTLHQLYSNQSAGPQQDLKLLLELKSEKRNINYHASYLHMDSGKLLLHRMTLRLAPEQEYSTLLELVDEETKKSFHIRGTLPSNSAYFRTEVVETSSNIWEVEGVAKWGQLDETKLVAKVNSLDSEIKMEKTVQADLTSPFFKPIKLAANFQTGQAKSTLQAKLQMAEDSYDIMVGHTFDGESHNIQCRVDAPEMKPVLVKAVVTLKYYERSISVEIDALKLVTFDAKYKNDAEEFLIESGLYWDKKVDINQSVTFKLGHTVREFETTLKYPGQAFSVLVINAPSKATGTISWSPRDKIAVILDHKLDGVARFVNGKIETPFRGYEKIEVSAEYEKDDKKFAGQVSGKWQTSHALISVSAVKDEENMVAAVSFNSNLKDFEKMDAKLLFTNSEVEKRLSLSASINGKTTELRGGLVNQGSYKHKGYKGEARLVTPYSEPVSIDFGYAREAGKIQAGIGANVADASVIRGQIEGQLSDLATFGKIQVNSTVSGYEEVAAGFDLISEKGNQLLAVQGNLNKKVIKAQLTTNRSQNKRTSVFKLAATLETPFTPAFTSNLAYTVDNGKTTSSGELALDGIQQASYTLNGTILSVTKFDVISSARVAGYDVTSKLTNDLDGTKISTGAEVAVNGKTYKFLVDGNNQADRKSRILYGKLKLSTPTLGDVAFHTEFTKKPTSIASMARLTYNVTSHAFSQKLSVKDITNFEGVLELESPQLSVKVRSQQVWNGRKFNHVTSLANSDKVMRFTASGEVRKDKIALQASGTGTISTPWSENIKLSFSHRQKDGELRPDIAITYGKSKEVKVSTVILTGSNSHSFSLNIAPNFCDPMLVAWNYDFRNQQKTASGMFEWQKGRRLELDFKGAVSALATDAKASIKTPLDGFKNVGFAVNYDLLAAEKKVNIFGNVDALKVELKSKAGMTATKIMAEASLATPIRGFEQISGNAVVDFNTKKAELTIKVANKDIKAVANYRLIGSKIIASLKYTNPFTENKSVSIDFNYDSARDKKIQIVLQTDKTRSDLIAKIVTSANSGDVEVIINTPIKDFEQMSLKTGYDVVKRNLLFNARKNSAEISFQARNHSGSIEMSLSTPFEIASDISLSAKYTASSIDATLSHNLQKCSLSASYDVKRNSIEASGTVSASFLSSEKITGSFKYDWSKPQQAVKAVLALGSSKVDFGGSFNIQNLLAPSGSFTLLTPYESVPEVRLAVSYDVRTASKSAEVKLTVVSTVYRVALGGSAQTRTGHASIVTEIPISGLEDLKVEGSYDLTSSPASAKVFVKKENINVINAEIEADLVHISAKASTSFTGFEELKFDSSIKRDDSLEVAVAASKNDAKLSVVLNKANNGLEIKIETPVKNWESLAFRTKYDLASDQKMFFIETSRNNEKLGLTAVGLLTLKNSDFTITLSSTRKEFENISLAIRYDVKDVISGAVAFEKNGKKKAISGDVNLSPTAAKVQINTPFEGYRDLEVSTKFEAQKAELTLRTEDRRSDFSALITFDGDATIATLRTPFSGFEELSATIRYDITGQKKSLSLSLSKNEQKIDLSGSLIFRSSYLAFESYFTSAIPGFERLDLTCKYEKTSDKLQTSFAAGWNTERYEAGVVAVDSANVIEVKADIVTPVRRWERLVIDGTIQKREKKATFIVNRNGEKHEVSGTLQYDSASFKATLETPFRGLETISIAAKYDDSSLEAGLHTTFRGFETLSISGDYDLKSDSKMARITLIKGINTYENIIRARFTSDEGAISAQSSLPFPGYENSSFDFIYDFNLNDGESSLIANAQYSQSRIESSLSLSFDEMSADFSARFVSPFRGYEDFEMTGKYDLNRVGKTAGLNLDVKGQPVIKLVGTFGITMQLSDIGLIISIPALSVEEAQLKLKHTFAPSGFDLESVVSIDNIFLNVIGHLEGIANGNVKVKVGSDVSKNQLPRQFEATWKVTPARVEGLLNLGQDKNIRTAIDLVAKSKKDFSVKGTLQTFFFEPLEFRVELNAVKLENSYLVVNYKSGDQTYTFDGKSITSEGVWQVESLIRSPLRNFESISVRARYGKGNAQAEAVFGSQKMDINVDFDFKKSKSNSQLRVSTPFWQPLEISYEYDVANNEKSSQALFAYGETRIRLSGVANIKSSSEAEARIQLTSNTAIDYIANIRYNFAKAIKTAYVEFKTNGVVTSVEAAISTDNLKPAVTFNIITPVTGFESLMISGNVDFTEGVAVKLSSRGALDLKAEFSANRKSVVGSLVTPFKEMTNLRLDSEFALEGPERHLHVTASNEDNHLTFGFTATKNHFNAKLEAPILKAIEIDGLLTTEDAKRLELTLTRDGHSSALSGTLLTGVEKGVKFQFTSPFTNSVELLISYDDSSDQQWAEALLRLKDEEIRVYVSRQLRPIMKAYLTVETRTFYPVVVEFELDQSSDNKLVRVKAGFDGKHIECQTSYRKSNDEDSLTASLALPVKGFENLAFSVTAKGNNIDVTIDYAPGQTVQFTGSSKIDSGFAVAGTLYTPFPAIRALSGELYFELSDKAKGGKLSAQWNDQSKLSVSGLLTSEKLEIALQTPFTRVRDFSIILNYKYSSKFISVSAEVQKSKFAIEGSYDDNTVNAKLTTNEKSFSVAAKFLLSPEALSTMLEVSTPYKSFEKFKLEFDGSLVPTDGNARLFIETPFPGLPSASFDAGYTMKHNKVHAKLMSVFLKEKLDIKLDLDYAAMSFSASSNVTFAPVLDGIKLSGKIEDSSRMKKQFQVVLEGKDFNHSFSGEFSLGANAMSVTSQLKSNRLSEPVPFDISGVISEKHCDFSFKLLDNVFSLKYNINSASFNINSEAVLPILNIPKTAFAASLARNNAQLSLLSDDSWHKIMADFQKQGNDFSGSFELDTSMLETKKTVKFTGSLPNGGYSPINIDATVEGDAVHTISAAVDLTENFKITGRSDSPYTGQVDVELSAGSLDGIIVIETQEATHKAKYQLIKSGTYEVQIDAESPYIADDRISARATLRRNAHILEAALTTETGSGSHTLSGELRHETDSLLFKIKAETSFLNLDVASLELRANRGRRSEVVFAMDCYRSVHKISASLQKDPVQAEAYLESPLLRGGRMAAILNTRYESGQQADAEVELTFGKKSLRFEGAAAYGTWKDMRLSANLTTPFEAFENGRFDAHFQADSGMNAGLDIVSSLSVFPQAAILFKYEPTETSYDASLIVKSPVSGYENAAVLVNVPLSSSSAEPRVTVTFRDQQYSAYGIFRFDDGKIEVTTVAEGGDKKIGGSIVVKQSDICEVKVEAFTPFTGYEKFSWELRGQLDIKNWADSKAFIDWGGERIELTTTGRAENGAFSTKLELKTPFVKYEKFVATVRLEKTERKTVQLEFEYSGQRVGVNFDYLFNTLTDFIIKASVSTPFVAFDRLNIELSNRVSSNSYSGTIEGQLFNLGFGLNIEGDLRSNSAEGSIEAKLNDYIIVLRGNSSITDKSVDATVTLSTPFRSIHSFDANVYLEKSFSDLNNVVAANLNGASLFSAIISNKKGGKTIEITNPIYPISLTYVVEKVDNVNKLVADFCWNIHKKATSTVGVEATFNAGLQKKLTAKAILPTRVVSLNASFAYSENAFENSLSASWKDGEAFGYVIVLNGESTGRRSQNDAVIRVDFPQRSFELEYHTATSRSEYAVAADFKWDAARDQSKKMGFTFDATDKSSWGATNKAYAMTLNHFKLSHDLILKTEFTMAAPTDLLLASMYFKYSEPESQLLLAQIAINDESSHAEKSYKGLLGMRHLQSGIDFKTSGEIYSQTSKLGGSLTLDYKDVNGLHQLINIATKLDKKHQKFALEATTAERSIELSAGLKKDDDHYSATILTSVDKEAPVKIEARADIERPSVKVHLHMNEKTVKAYAGFVTDKEIMAKVSHDYMGKTVVDGLFSLKLESNKVLSNKANWRAESLQEFKSAVISYTSAFTRALTKTKDEISSFINEERGQKLIPPKNVFSDIYTVYATGYAEEIVLIADDFVEVINTVNKMYINDDFFIKSIVEFAIKVQSKFVQASARTVSNISCIFSAAAEGLKKTGMFILDAALDVYNKVGTVLPLDFLKDLKVRVTETTRYFIANFAIIANDVKKSLEVLVDEVKPMFEKYYGKLEEAIMKEIEAVQERWISVVRSYAEAAYSYTQRFKHVYEWTKEKYDVVVRLVEDFKAEAYRRIITYPLVEKTLKLYKVYYAWLEEVHFQEYLELVANEFTGVAKAQSEKFQAATAPYQPYIKAAVQLVKGQYELVKQVPPVAYFSTILDRAFLEVQKMYSLLEMKDQLNEYIRNGLRRLDKAMNTLSDEMKGAAGDINFKNMINFGSSSGKFQATVNLPFEWNTLKELPNFKSLPIYERAHLTRNAILDYIDFSDHHFFFLDQYARFSPEVIAKNVFPPFGSHGLIAGNQHYMTFDRKFFEFAGECSYLLVNDFADGNFSVLVNYEGSSGTFTKKSLTVVSKGKQLEITPSKVVVDGKRVELPYQDEDLVVFLDGHRITLETSRGARVECNLHRDACTVHVSGWSFGNTAGLFGIYNYEPSDDFTTSNRELRSDSEVDTFAYSWRVGTSRCRVKNVASVAKSVDPKAEEICVPLFDDETSYLRPCFNLVDSAPYKKMCLNDLSALTNSAKQDLGACTAATAYAMECRLHGVDLWVPPMCVRCELENKNVLRTGESVAFNSTATPAPKSADVVFLVEQKKCLKNTRISTISQEIDHAMKEKGYTGNRYAVVTFGGKGVFENPHIRTADSEAWNNRKVVQKAFEGLPYDGTETSDAIGAIKYATRLAYRAGVSKHLILISCEAVCHAVDYGDAATLLLENDFKLHILRPEKFKLKGKQSAEDSKLISQIYGYDAKNIYTLRSSSRRAPDESNLRHQLIVPKDFCTPLATETNGSIFDLNKIVGEKSISPKRVVEAFARRFAATAEPAPCQRCDCLGDKDGFGTVHCQRCVSPAIDKFLRDWEAVYESSLENISNEEMEIREAEEPQRLKKA